MYSDFIQHPRMAAIRSRTVWIHVEIPGQGPDAPDLPAELVVVQRCLFLCAMFHNPFNRKEIDDAFEAPFSVRNHSQKSGSLSLGRSVHDESYRLRTTYTFYTLKVRHTLGYFFQPPRMYGTTGVKLPWCSGNRSLTNHSPHSRDRLLIVVTEVKLS
jgi:hypothetical protein